VRGTPTITVRVPVSVSAGWSAAAAERGISRSDLIRGVMEAAVGLPEGVLPSATESSTAGVPRDQGGARLVVAAGEAGVSPPGRRGGLEAVAPVVPLRRTTTAHHPRCGCSMCTGKVPA